MARPASGAGGDPMQASRVSLGRRGADDRGRPPHGTLVTGKCVRGGAGEQEGQTEGARGQRAVDSPQAPEGGIAPVTGGRRCMGHRRHAAEWR
jgi:hypothetical protein